MINMISHLPQLCPRRILQGYAVLCPLTLTPSTTLTPTLGEYSKAMQYYARAAELAPDNPSVVNNIGFLYEQQGDDVQAAVYYR